MILLNVFETLWNTEGGGVPRGRLGMKKQVKRLVYLVLSFMFLVTSILGFSGTASASTTPVPLSSMKAGNTVKFAGYTWIVLDPSTGYLLMQSSYNPNYDFDSVSQNFGGSDIESLLNYTFYSNLPTADSALIQTHCWDVKDENGNTISGSSGSVWAYIGLLSYNDWKTYSKYYNTATGFLDTPSDCPWTLTPSSSILCDVWCVSPGGGLDFIAGSYFSAVRPALYLKSDILVSGGDGGTVLEATPTPTITTPVTAGATSVSDTALAIAEANYPGKVANVILATADNYPDES